MTSDMRSRSNDRASAGGIVRPLRPVRDDAQLVEALRSGQSWARAAFFDRYAPLVERIVRRILGNERHVEIADVVHDAFVQALTSLDRLRDPKALSAWMEAVPVHTAHKKVERASSGELLLLSDAARFAGHPEKASEALLAMRRRFADRGRSAFLLGKIAADQQGSYGDAVTWFQTYLAEEANGPLAEQALGRLLELKRTADPEGARAIAEPYLARYPTGAYAALAQRLANR